MTGLTLAYCLDHRFIEHGDQILSESQFEAAYWERFLGPFDNIIVFARKGRIPPGQSPDDMLVSTHAKVRFVLLPNLSSPLTRLRQSGAVRDRVAEGLQNADAVICRLPSEIGLIGAAFSAGAMNGPIHGIEMAGCAWDAYWNYGSVTGKAYAPVIFQRCRSAVRAAPFVHYVTRHFLQDRFPPGPGATTVGISDVVIPALDPACLDARLERLKNRTEPLKLGLIGTLRGRFKGIQTVLKALSLASAPKDIVFEVLGPGDPAPWQGMAQKLGVANRVRFLGTRPGGQPVMDWLDTVDIYTQPSLKEGLPRALVEAMSRGCPAIGARTAGIPELLDPAALIDAGDAAGFAARLGELASDPTQLAALATQNFKTASDFTIDKLDATRRRYFDALSQAARGQG